MKRRLKIVISILCTILLLGGGAYVWLQRQEWLTDAAAAGNLPAVRILYFLGTDLNGSPEDESGEEGEPAFLAAVDNGHENVVQFFIQHHVDIEVTYSDIQSPLEAAIGNRNVSMTNLLLRNGAKLRHDWVDPNTWRPPLAENMVSLLRKYDHTPSQNK